MKVYRLNGEAFEVEKSEVVLTDRSRINEGRKCPRKRWLKYEALGTGVESRWKSEDLELGKAVHAGLDLVMRNHDYQTAAEVARDRFLAVMDLEIENDNGALALAAPEIAQVLKEEQGALVEALVWTFGRRLAPTLQAEYEVVSTEEEINWLLGNGERPLVMMSRSDGIWRRRADGRLYAVSYKTAKKFESWTLDNLECDSQGLTEGLATRARYGEEPAGILYFYLLKGTKYQDKELGVKRYTNSLVRPWFNGQAGLGEVLPSQFAMEYEFYDPVEGRTRRLGKGWQRVDVWKMMEMKTWLGWLDAGLVQPECERDWLGEVVAQPAVREFDSGQAERWRRGAEQAERVRAAENFLIEKRPDLLDVYAPLSDQACFSFGKRCFAFGVCFRGETIEQKVLAGDWQARRPNHEVERGDGEE